ncbi:hypothetical protein WJX73_001599 [Symbiochloris irregularis]|uniref:phosphoribosylanthranilate isomerase n=1 Tax=Symbiochloris irregularis TaxID=706552 RepID=A0AAW1P086_9CHLO
MRALLLHANAIQLRACSFVPARQWCRQRNNIACRAVAVNGAALNKDPLVKTPLPTQAEGSRHIDWLLVDGMNPGSGEAYDWAAVQVPADSSSKGWLLAGGLNHMNVQQTLAAVRPTAVDVSSGVAGPDGLRKDAAKIEAFMQAVARSRTPVKAAMT